VIPGGMARRAVPDTADICAIAAPISVAGSKYILSMDRPGMDCDLLF